MNGCQLREKLTLHYLNVLCPDIVSQLTEAERNLRKYIELALQHGGDPSMCDALTRFRKLHRNPLMHPDASLDVDEALSLLDSTKVVISSLVLWTSRSGHIPNRRRK